MIILSQTLKTLSSLSALQKYQENDNTVVEVGKGVTKNQPVMPFAPTFRNIAEVTNYLTSILKEVALIPLTAADIALTPVKLVRNAFKKLEQKTGHLTETQAVQFLQTANQIPIAVDSELHVLWENLLIHSTTEDYHPTYADILSALRTQDAKLLDSFVSMTISKKSIVISNFTNRNLPSCFFLNRKLQREKLALSLTVLERESLISTSNNLGTYVNSEMLGSQAKLDPKAHQVTPLGLALHRACNPITNFKKSPKLKNVNRRIFRRSR